MSRAWLSFATYAAHYKHLKKATEYLQICAAAASRPQTPLLLRSIEVGAFGKPKPKF